MFDTKQLGSGAITVGATVAGAVGGNLLQSKISFFNSTLGRVLLIALALIIISKSKSEVMKGVGTGLAVGASLGFIKDVTAGVKGFEGLSGIEADAMAGVGELVQDENGMMYMVNGVGELEPYGAANQMQGYEPIAGFKGVGAAEALIAA
jgi:hypothetical protein